MYAQEEKETTTPTTYSTPNLHSPLEIFTKYDALKFQFQRISISVIYFSKANKDNNATICIEIWKWNCKR